MATFGLEEEVFVVEPVKPSLTSMYYLSRLLWSDPRFNYRGTASNFARGKDVKQGLMSGVEVSTGVHAGADGLIADLVRRRTELAGVSEGLIVPIGHLINLDAPTNVCALQFHVGNVGDQDRVYDNLLHFLPVLTLLSINAPYAGRKYFGQSYRMAKSFAIGPVGPEKTDRFQDIIIAKRLGTIEIRVFDPTWDIERVRVLARAIEKITEFSRALPGNPEKYNAMRARIARLGFIPEMEPILAELQEIADVPEGLVKRTASDQVKETYERLGLLATYSAMDNGYRSGVFEHRRIPEPKARALKAAVGLAGYYLPKLPYAVWKYIKES